MIHMYADSQLKKKFIALENMKMIEDFLETVDTDDELCEHLKAFESHSTFNNTTSTGAMMHSKLQQHQHHCNPVAQKSDVTSVKCAKYMHDHAPGHTNCPPKDVKYSAHGRTSHWEAKCCVEPTGKG